MKPTIKFIHTTLENLEKNLDIKYDFNNEYILGLSNSDFFINIIEIPNNFTDNQKYQLIDEQLSIFINDYTPLNYINKLILNNLTSDYKQILVVTLSRINVEKIVNFFLEKNIFLIGIYPSFLLNDQKNLNQLSNELQFPTITELKYENTSSPIDVSPLFVLLNQGKIFDLKEEILIKKDISEYNFLQSEYKNKFHKPLINIKIIIFFILFFQFFFSLSLNYFTNKIELKIHNLKIQQKEIELKIKKIEKEILEIPNWDIKNNELRYFFPEKNTEIHEILYLIKKYIPSSMFIDKFSIKNSFIYLNGIFKSNEEFFQFERNLVSNSFTNIKYDIISENEKEYTFSLKAKTNEKGVKYEK